MTFNHTPGPWTHEGADQLDDLKPEQCHRISSTLPGKWSALALVVTRFDDDVLDSKEGIANARLIAAAPELLSALQRLRWDFDLILSRKPCRDVAECRAEVDAAITKATGETP